MYIPAYCPRSEAPVPCVLGRFELSGGKCSCDVVGPKGLGMTMVLGAGVLPYPGAFAYSRCESSMVRCLYHRYVTQLQRSEEMLDRRSW